MYDCRLTIFNLRCTWLSYYNKSKINTR